MEVKSTTAPMEISHDIFPRLQPQIYSWINLYGRNFLRWINAQPLLVVTDINLIKEILSDKEGSFDKVQLQGVLKKFLGDGFVFQEGVKWSKLRKVANHVFHGQCLKIEAGKILQAFSNSLVGIIKQRDDKVKAGQSDNFGGDFLGSLMESHYNADQNKRITVDEIIEECKTFYFAGHETVRTVLSWSILFLAVYTDWQDTARKEVLKILGQENPYIESVSRLKMVGMIINETLKLYPPSVHLERKVTRKIRLGEPRIPAGLEVYIASLAVHHNSEIWGENTHLFKPQRFAEGVAKATRDQLMVFLSFGFGLRKCVGYNFAHMEMKIALCMFLQRDRFTISPDYSHFPTFGMGLWPKYGIQIMLHPLQTNYQVSCLILPSSQFKCFNLTEYRV